MGGMSLREPITCSFRGVMREYDWSKQLPIKPSLPYAMVFWNEDRGERQKQMQKKNVKSDPKIDQTHRNCSSGLSYKQIAQLPPLTLATLSLPTFARCYTFIRNSAAGRHCSRIRIASHRSRIRLVSLEIHPIPDNE